MAGNGSGAGDLSVEVRRPLQRPAPHRRLRQRAAARRRRRKERREQGDSNWWDVPDLSLGDDPVSAVIAFVVIAIALVLFFVFVGPWLWLVILFLVELLIWLVLGLVGLAAWLVFRRPWHVAVVDTSTGATVATHAVDGRRRARDHATVVEQRLANGIRPDLAVVGH